MNCLQLSPAQLHSCDLRIRLPLCQIENLRLFHLDSMLDASVLAGSPGRGAGTLRAGWTEWDGLLQGRRASLAWDWVELSDGALHPHLGVPPRTNLQLLDRKGYDLPLEDNDRALWVWIQGLPWTDQVLEAVSGRKASV